jgi:hypothetical protein
LFTNWISFSALLVVQFGFAALLGAMVSQTRRPFERALLAASGLLYVGASLALPLSLAFRLVVWVASALLFAGFLNTSLTLRANPRLGWLYLTFAMALILAWSATQSPQIPLLALGATAALAAAVAWRRSLSIAG